MKNCNESGRRHVYRSNSTNTTMAEKNTENELQNVNATDTMEGRKKKKFSRAMSFDVKALTAVWKHNNDSTMQESPKMNSPRQKKSYTEHKHPSTSNSDIEDELQDQQFSIQYLGYQDLKSPGITEIVDTVTKMYDSAKPFLKSIAKSRLVLTRDGISIKHAGGSDASNSNNDSQMLDTNERELSYKPRRILYCGVDKKHQRVFSFNYQYGARAENIQLHVLVCKNKEDAKSVAKYLAQLFRLISTSIHKKEKEDKKQHQEGLTKFKAKSSTNIHTYTNMTYPDTSVSSKDGSCSTGTCGSGERVADKDRDRVQLSMA